MRSLQRPQCTLSALLEPGFWGGRLYRPLSAPVKSLEKALNKELEDIQEYSIQCSALTQDP